MLLLLFFLFMLTLWSFFLLLLHLYFVVESLSPLHNIHIGLSLILFVALSAALVSALPITPSGLGAVEFAIVGVLVLVGGGSGRVGGDCHTGPGHKLLGIDGGGGYGVCGEREEVVANR